MSVDRSNIVAVARREYLFRARTRTFKLTTALLVVVALALTLAPLIIRVFDKGTGQKVVEVYLGDASPHVDVPLTLFGVLNAPPATSVATPGPGATAEPSATAAPGTVPTPAYRVTTVSDLEAARARVLADATAGLLIVDRPTADGDLTFDYVSKASALESLPDLVHRAVALIAIQDRLTNAGVPPQDQAALFAPPSFKVSAADPNASPGTTPGSGSGGNFANGFVLAIALYIAIILYGQWIAYSVVEEKSSRVMEVILGAATPFELLAGKVVGVGALALTQYVIVFAPAAVALLFQDQIAVAILGGAEGATGATGSAGMGLLGGLSIGLLAAFGLFFILGFALYSVLYAGAAALVSRTEDINQIIAPMTIVSTAGYLVAVYSSTGLLDPSSTLVVVMSYIPFFSPYLMLSRLGAGVAGPLEIIVSMVILAIFVPLALWVAARFYAAGVLMYGQRPGLRLMLRVLRRGPH